MNQQPYTIALIARWLDAETSLVGPDHPIRFLAYDTRQLNQGEQTLFFALLGRRDGHGFIPEAYEAGVRDFVVLRSFDAAGRFPGANFLYVDDTLCAMQRIAGKHRESFKGRVLAITGSNGKTIVKEWLYQLMSPELEIIRSPKSYNSQLGVALSLWELNDSADLAIIEAGISLPGEMSALEEMIRPEDGILTNIKNAHLENFTSRKALSEEKMQLFKRCTRMVYNPADVPKSSIPETAKKFTWSKEDTQTHVTLQVLETNSSKGNSTRIRALYRASQYSIEIPFTDSASIENAIICWVYMLQAGYPHSLIAERMQKLNPLQMRLELKQGHLNSSVIDDSYSFDVSSLAIALNFLYQQRQHQRRVVILSDLPYKGPREADLYRQVSLLLQQTPLYKFIGIGPRLQAHRSLFENAEALFYPATSDFLEAFAFEDFRDCTILVKGARRFRFEQIVQRLELKTHETRLEIDLNALSHNLKQYQQLVPPATRIMGMVKAFSYGSGSFEVAAQLQFHQADYLAVAYADEGVELRKNGIHIPIMVMNPDPNHFQAIVNHRLEPEIYSIPLLQAFATFCRSRNIKQFPVHIKLETGMNRLGLSDTEIPRALSLLSGETLKVISVFSHLAAAGDPGKDAFTHQQLEKFSILAGRLEEELGYSFLRHIANTAGILRFPEAHMDMVRPGIGLYGISEVDTPLSLQNVLSLKTRIAQIKTITDQDTVGYNRSGHLDGGGRIATVKIGYADGYDRRLGNGVGRMRIGAHLAPTIGDICMDMCMLDVSNIPAREGDEVVVFGSDPQVTQVAASAGMIPYELLTGISQRVKRIYFYG